MWITCVDVLGTGGYMLLATGTSRRFPTQDVLALAVVKNVYVSCSVRDHFVKPSQAAFFRPTEIR
jgi:hypothetical protein